MSWRTAKGRAGKRHVKKIEWTETAIPRPASRAIAARATPMVLVPSLRRRNNYRTGGLLGMELKCVDQQYTSTALTTSWAGGEHDPAAALCIGPSVQGTGLANRDGQRVVFKSIFIQGYFNRVLAQNQPDVRGSSICMVAIVQDTQTNAAQLNAEDVYSTAGVDAFALRVLEFRSRFKVLWRHSVVMNDLATITDGANTGSIVGPMKKWQKMIKLNVPVTFVAGAGAGTIADFRDNSFHVIACSTGADDTIAYNVRTRFVG